MRRLSLVVGVASLVAFAAALLIGFSSRPAAATANSRVFINGRPAPVFFNDGDSFRVHGGEYRGGQARLSGYNTLESFGPAHFWGDWHPYELYVNAKMATIHARRGVWHCRTDGSRDGYGRLLMDCPDLALSQIRRGFAHAYQVDDTPARPSYLRAQQDAIRNRRGMWAHGVPDYVMTSIHSADEDVGREAHYNRLISTRDAHTESMRHRDTYARCSWVCNTEVRVDVPRCTAAARRLRGDPSLAPLLSEFFNLHLLEFVSRYRRTGELPEYLPEPARSRVASVLAAEQRQGRLGATERVRGSCMLHVPFRERYGRGRAPCLRGHGAPPGGGGGH